jgi:multidrug transporter EmrE-like cation transporter
MLLKLMILVVTLNSLASQLLLKRAVTSIGSPASFGELVPFFQAAVQSPPVYVSLFLQVIGYALWMIVISKEKLGIAVAVLGSGFYVAIALIGWFVFDEPLSRLQWVGVLLITLGIACMMA